MPFLGNFRAVYNTALTVDEATATETLGLIGIDPTTGNLFRYVKNASSSALAQGDWCCYDTPNARNAADVVVPATANLDRLAGLVYNGITNAQHGWIQITGYSSTAKTNGTTAITAQDSLKPSNGLRGLVKDTSPGTTPTYHAFAYGLQANSTSGDSTATQAVKICCLGTL